MARATIWIVIFLVTLNSASVAIAESGAADDWGIDPQTGVNEGDEPRDAADDLNPQTQAADGLVGVVIGVFGSLQSVVDFVFRAPTMFGNLGVPSFVVSVAFAPLYLLVFADLAYLLTGRLL
jgi:hypothetical protein